MTHEASEYPHFTDMRYILEQTLESVVHAAKQRHQEEQFDAVITTDEASVLSVAAIADALSLPGISVSGAAKSRNKYYMRQAHQAHAAPCPDFRLCDSLESAQKAAKAIGYPVIIKPTLGANAEHAYLVRDEQALNKICQRGRLDYSHDSKESISVLLHDKK